MPSKKHSQDREVSNEKSTHPNIARQLKKETAMGRQLIAQIIKEHHNDPLRQISEFMETFQIPAANGRKRNVSIATVKAYRDRLTVLVNTLRALNMPINNLDEITAKQVRKFFENLEEEGRSASWMANMNTSIRRFGIWQGKPDLCPVLKKLVVNPQNAVRHLTAMTPKDWEAVGVDAEEAIQGIEQTCHITGLQLRLAKEFGVRVQEFLMFKPLLAQEAKGFIYIRDGAKGGRPRQVPIETDEQRRLLAIATELAEKNPRGLVMTKDWRTLHQALNHFYYRLRKVGINKKTFGITAHGLRHGYACRTYKLLTGEAAPVMGGGMVDASLDKAAREEITTRMGHSRIEITNAYLGSYKLMGRNKRKNLERLTEVLENDPVLKEAASAAGLEGFYVLGAAAAGNPVARGQLMSFAYRAQKRFDETQAQADRRVAMDAMDMALRAGQLLEVQAAVVPMSNIVDAMEQYELVGITQKGASTVRAGSAAGTAISAGV